MFGFNKEEVYMGYSLNDLAKVRDVLQCNKIPYSYKVMNLGGRGLARGHHGSFGLNMDYERQYIVSVKKRDYEKASYLVNGVLHSNN
ncbi:MAG: hypothetical protein K0S47_4105 [Herbinix sp.]|jgi:hypothetical protein|nr:hypothetical protein [Herbinix sp.]